MRIYITGAGGFIGGRLAAHFAQQGAEVRSDVSPAAAGGRMELTSAALATQLGPWQPDVLIHAAGSGTVSQVASDPQQQVPANLAATLAVLEHARSAAPRAHVVLLSSAAVYGRAPALPQREADAREPVSLYGLSKAQSEQLLAHYAAQHGLRTTAVRLFSVYGSGLRKQLLWDALCKYAAGRNEFFGTGDERRDWVHASDVCRFISALVARAAPPGFEVYNCAGQPATTREVLSLLAQEAGAPPPRFNGQSRVGDPVWLVADCSKAAQDLGWQPQVDWRQGMAEYRRWHAALALPGGAHP